MADEVTPAWMERTFAQVKNWGRWGADDQRGALHYITPERRAAAAALVREGAIVGCALELPVEPAPDNPTPALHMMVAAGDACTTDLMPGLEMTLDWFGVACHGGAVSHIDALCHVFVDGRMYNGFPASDVKSSGAQRNSITAAAPDGIAGRGVLLDVPRVRGVRWLELGERVTPDDLLAAERAQGVTVGEGDILLVATGRHERRDALGPWVVTEQGMAGLHPSCIPWLHERRIAVLGSDGFSDAIGAPPIPGWPVPVHQCCLVAMGVHLLDNLDLRALARACAERRRSEFFFVVQPLRIAHATGSPVNPTAIF